jgi:chromosome segregation ATPase
LKKEFEKFEKDKKKISEEKRELELNLMKLQEKQELNNQELKTIQTINSQLNKDITKLDVKMQKQEENHKKAKQKLLEQQEYLREQTEFERKRYEEIRQKQEQMEINKRKQQERRQKNLEQLKADKLKLEKNFNKLQVLDNIIEGENASWFKWFAKDKKFYRDFNQNIKFYEISGDHPDCIVISRGGVGYKFVEVVLKGHFSKGFTRVKFFGYLGESEAYKYEMKSLNKKIDNLYLVITFDK